jgi:hypothetical protein
MESQRLSNQINKDKVINKLHEAQKLIAEAYEEALLTELADLAVELCWVIYHIEEDL